MPDIPQQQVESKKWQDALDTSISTPSGKSETELPPRIPSGAAAGIDSANLARAEISVVRPPEAGAVETENPAKVITARELGAHQDYAALNMPGRHDDRSARSMEAFMGRGAAADYQPTVLDKIVDFIASLLKKFEQFLIGKLRRRLERRKYRLHRLERDDTEQPQSMADLEFNPEALPSERIKWQARAGKRRGV